MILYPLSSIAVLFLHSRFWRNRTKLVVTITYRLIFFFSTASTRRANYYSQRLLLRLPTNTRQTTITTEMQRKKKQHKKMYSRNTTGRGKRTLQQK